MSLTRDSLSFAMKATSVVVNSERKAIFKYPKTGDGIKKSAKGLLRVELEDGEYTLYDEQTPEQEEQGVLELVFLDGTFTNLCSFDDIKYRLTV